MKGRVVLTHSGLLAVWSQVGFKREGLGGPQGSGTRRPLFGSSRWWWWQWGLDGCRGSLDGQDALRGECGGHGRRVHARWQEVAAMELTSDETMLVLERERLERPGPCSCRHPTPHSPHRRAHRTLLVACVHLHMVTNHLDSDFLRGEMLHIQQHRKMARVGGHLCKIRWSSMQNHWV